MPDQCKQAIICYIALGSNIGDSTAYLKTALKALDTHPSIHFLNTSRFYKSKPHGPQGQPDYINAAVSFETRLEAEELLDVLQGIENENGRDRKNVERWGARTLDLDLLFYDDQIINTKRLTVPHPRICERAFVLFPMRDLGADLKSLGETTIKECIEALSSEALSDIKEIVNDG